MFVWLDLGGGDAKLTSTSVSPVHAVIGAGVMTTSTLSPAPVRLVSAVLVANPTTTIARPGTNAADWWLSLFSLIHDVVFLCPVHEFTHYCAVMQTCN